MAYSLNDVMALTLFYKTPELIDVAIKSFRKFYPEVKMLVLNNSPENDACTAELRKWVSMDNHSSLYTFETNLGHGAAIHEGIKMIKTPCVYIFESDVLTLKHGVIEAMLEIMNESIYAIGTMDYVTYDKGQWTNKDSSQKTMRRVWIYSSLINIKKYYEFPPFDNDNGTNAAPLKKAMRGIHDTGRENELLVSFNVDEYVKHLYGSTRTKYGIPKT